MIGLSLPNHSSSPPINNIPNTWYYCQNIGNVVYLCPIFHKHFIHIQYTISFDWRVSSYHNVFQAGFPLSGVLRERPPVDGYIKP